jgi:hypothetical protein
MVIKFDQVIDDIKIADYSNRKIVLSTQKGEPIRFQIPKMYMPFGISGFTPEIGNKKWNVDFSMRGFDESEGIIKKCYDVLRQIEDKIINNVAEQSEEIFGKKMTYDELRPLFNSKSRRHLVVSQSFVLKLIRILREKLNRLFTTRKRRISAV